MERSAIGGQEHQHGVGFGRVEARDREGFAGNY